MKKIIFALPISVLLFSFSYLSFPTEPWVAPSEAKKISNPTVEARIASSAKKGKVLFKERCVVCHGDAGKGDGPGGKSLDPKPADFTSEKVQKQVDGEIFWKITNGRGAMIKWEPILSERERWDLVNYIRTLKVSK